MKTQINLRKKVKAVRNLIDARRYRKMSDLDTKLMKAERDLDYKKVKELAFKLRDYATASMKKASSDQEREQIVSYIDRAKDALYKLTINHAI